MKRLLATLGFLFLLMGNVSAAPYLVSDPSPDSEVDSCKIAGEGFTAPCVIGSDKAIKVDLAFLPKGRGYTITAQFCDQGGLWCSDPSVPFTFAVPIVGSPLDIRLSIQ